MEAVVCINSIDNGAEISPLLRALTHVKRLTVNDLILQAICSVCGQSNNLLAFRNVKMLSISKNQTNDEGLIALLKRVPKLETLEFDEYVYDEVKYISDAEDDEVDDNEDDDASSVESKNSNDNEGEGDVSNTAECDNND
ncbi:acidic leucine-rich nuclear phosphoprotein 32 family member E-like [Papaver somniferum]|uniref:acidic leucine-rich nuclear phosphoprotein 32 family member E-like n=1 Tax=Papaver somniferum TaxID=3469 RepID=UPI000E6FE565|nr:acidic leucine-rich nuclear phosphoprotein 32 family member E-like [Papaver somniferum]